MLCTKGRILCTEDHDDTRDMIDFSLTLCGFEVVCAVNSTHAVDLAKAQEFDLYLVDTWMPGLTGTTLTEKIREFDVKTPVLFYSSAASGKDIAAALASGAQGYLAKPADCDQLIAEVVRLIAESKSLPCSNMVNDPLPKEASNHGKQSQDFGSRSTRC